MSDSELLDNGEQIKIPFWKRILTSAYYVAILVLFTYGLAIGCIVFYTTCGLILGTLDDGFFTVIWERLILMSQAKIRELKVWRVFALIDFLIFLWLMVVLPETKRVKT